MLLLHQKSNLAATEKPTKPAPLSTSAPAELDAPYRACFFCSLISEFKSHVDKPIARSSVIFSNPIAREAGNLSSK
jgi:hypothetical protein